MDSRWIGLTNSVITKPLVATDVKVNFKTPNGIFEALKGISIEIQPGRTLALVGESGCGKTTFARAVLGLQPYEGSILLEDHLVNGASKGQSAKVGMVWQDPFASLDPRWKVGKLIEEPAKLLGRNVDLDSILKKVGLNESFASRFPHQMSGGQRQRVAIARALVTEPSLIICDEPTAALDLSIQAQILNLLKELQTNTGTSMLYISHDLATVQYIAQDVAVMQSGEVVEYGPVEKVLVNPQHPYTQKLLDSMLSSDRIGHLPSGE